MFFYINTQIEGKSRPRKEASDVNALPSFHPLLNSHCPQAKPTTVCDTPEIRRLAENTRNQSQVKYHEDFEKAKGKVTQVADDPETMRIRNASKMISNVAYHGDLEKKRQMEDRRAFLPNESNAPEPAGILQQLQQHQQHLSNSGSNWIIKHFRFVRR